MANKSFRLFIFTIRLQIPFMLSKNKSKYIQSLARKKHRDAEHWSKVTRWLPKH